MSKIIMRNTKNSRSKGFTLIEVLLVIAMLAILAAVVIIAINPAKQFGEAQNAQRRSDVSAILDAIHQYGLDNQGGLPSEDISSATSCDTATSDICRAGVVCDGVNLDNLIADELYLRDIPVDPTVENEEITGYRIFKSDYDRIGICAPNAYGEEEISVIR